MSSDKFSSMLLGAISIIMLASILFFERTIGFVALVLNFSGVLILTWPHLEPETIKKQIGKSMPGIENWLTKKYYLHGTSFLVWGFILTTLSMHNINSDSVIFTFFHILFILFLIVCNHNLLKTEPELLEHYEGLNFI